MFSRQNVNLAESAINFYISVFNDVKLGNLARYQEDTGPAKAGSLMFGDFMLANQWFAAMDAGVEQDFIFNEACSFAVSCQDQAEIDYYWEKLSHVPEGYRLAWHIPDSLIKMLP
jgi:predicted 3-demethylubiquinone-9 3-methyltransferase (glyoxalase superfamily)